MRKPSPTPRKKTNTEKWDNHYGDLVAFKKRFGHCNMKVHWKENKQLATWTMALRVRRKKGRLSDERIQRLDRIGFIWNWQSVKSEETWMKFYRELEDYAARHGNPHVSRTYSNRKLANWVWIQRQRRKGNYKRGNDPLTRRQTALLDKLGFYWDGHMGNWLAKFDKLKEFKATHGHCNVRIEGGDRQLLMWADWQRVYDKRGTLHPKRKAMLDGIGFNWGHTASETYEWKWLQIYDRLKQYRARHGNTDVPRTWKEDPALGAWAGNQRAFRKKGCMSHRRIQLLDELGFAWKLRRGNFREKRLAP